MKEEDNTQKGLTIVVAIIILISLLRNCESKSDNHNGYHQSDPEMNRVGRY